MKAKFRVGKLREIDGKCYVLPFETPYGEELGAFFNADSDVDLINTRYPEGLIDCFDVVPYFSKGKLGLSVSAPLTELSQDELF